MQPVKSDITTSGKCLNPVNTKCVVWDGPDITCLDGTTLCKGQTIDVTLYTLATKLCDIYTALNLDDINTCINNINDGSSVSIGPTSSIKEVFSAIIKKVCTLDTRVTELENSPCLEQVAVVPECLRVQAASYPSYNSVTFTLPLRYYAELVANSVCGILIDITGLQNNALIINQQINDLWTALDTCSNATQNTVLPTCTYNYSISPTGAPVTVQTAYSWLEADFCTLRGAVGTTTEITNAVNTQCANLANEDRLSGSGTMSTLAGWVDNPISIADAISNLWLTVCDMRTEVARIVDTCCFSMCDYLGVGYVANWSIDGTEVTISFIDPSNPVVYTSGLVPPAVGSPFSADGTTPLPAWATTQFPLATQSPVLFTLSDGSITFTISTGDLINNWAQSSTQFVIDFTTMAPPGYNQTVEQQLQITFSYDVVIGAIAIPCNYDQTDTLVYECNAPMPYACKGGILTSSTTGTDMYIKVTGLVQNTGNVISSTTTGVASASNRLKDTTQSFGAGDIGYIVTITDGPAAGQCRYITSIVSSTEVQVDSNWDVNPTVNTYTVEDIHYSYPFTGTGVTGFNINVVLNDPSFDINDQSTWQSYFSIDGIAPATIATGQGYYIIPNALVANTDYIVLVSATYPCGASDYATSTQFNQIATSVTIQTGRPGVPAIFIFNTASTQVTNVISDGVSLSSGTATITLPVTYALALPNIPNTTELTLIPNSASWYIPTTTPKVFCYCGINTNPVAVGRDNVLGQYRGYAVELYTLDLTNNYIPISDANGLVYKTDSITDPNITFALNSPTLGGPPPVGSPITLSIPSTYSQSSYPVVVRYDNTQYPVNLGNTFHTITFTDYDVTINVGPAVAFGNSISITYTAEIKYWDPGTNSYVSYATSPIRQYSYTEVQLIPAAGTYTINSPVGNVTTLSAGYGDGLFISINVSDYNFPTDSTGANASIIILPSSSVQNYSCSGLFNNNTAAMIGGPGQAKTLTSKCIITEDYDFRAPNLTITIL
jgi:hypothetical protein